MLLSVRPGSDVVLVDAATGATVTVEQIVARAAELSGAATVRGLSFLVGRNTIENVRDFLALLEAGIPVALLDPAVDGDVMGSLTDAYRPDLVIGAEGPEGYAEVLPGVRRSGSPGPVPHPELAVLLTTSGSTGSPKFVRLSAGNVRANAEQISASLGLSGSDRGVTALPLFYSFGMSVITSHAVAGSSVLVTDRGLLDAQFWDDLRTYTVSLLPGVPQSFAMLKRLGFAERELPRLRALLQAGGRLPVDLVDEFDAAMKARGGALYVMYGQTEAAPRIACLPPERLPDKRGSAGVALAGGRLVATRGDEELAAGEVGEIVYSGPNVMMGYATSRADLALGDVQGTALRTGDLGYVDADGFLFLTGRTKRIAKLAGERVSLDEIEGLAADLGPVAAVDAGERGVVVFTTETDESTRAQARRGLARKLRVAVRLIGVEFVDALPTLANGKVDYPELTRLTKEQT